MCMYGNDGGKKPSTKCNRECGAVFLLSQVKNGLLVFQFNMFTKMFHLRSMSISVFTAISFKLHIYFQNMMEIHYSSPETWHICKRTLKHNTIIAPLSCLSLYYRPSSSSSSGSTKSFSDDDLTLSRQISHCVRQTSSHGAGIEEGEQVVSFVPVSFSAEARLIQGTGAGTAHFWRTICALRTIKLFLPHFTHLTVAVEFG